MTRGTFSILDLVNRKNKCLALFQNGVRVGKEAAREDAEEAQSAR